MKFLKNDNGSIFGAFLEEDVGFSIWGQVTFQFQTLNSVRLWFRLGLALIHR